MPYEAVRAAAARVSDAELDARGAGIGVDDVINMQYTSGTTGFPKGVMLSSRNIVNNGEALGRDARLHAGRSPVPVRAAVPLLRLRHRRARRVHAWRLPVSGRWRSTRGRCSRPSHRERCTALYGVPTMFIAELECPDFARFDLTSLRTGVMAGALCPEPLMRRVMTDMHLPEITIAYGMTESSPGITMTPRDSSVAQRSQTVGPVLPELEVKIVDPATGEPSAAPGERGELCCRGYNVMKGYYNNPEATRAAIDADGWLHTGDEASLDADGCFRITGRIKDIIIRGGENIAPKEIEDCLREHPAVADAYVYGVPDAFFGEAVAAAVRLKEVPGRADAGASRADELIAWCAARPREVQSAALPEVRAGVSDDRVREDSEVQAARGARESNSESSSEVAT